MSIDCLSLLSTPPHRTWIVSLLFEITICYHTLEWPDILLFQLTSQPVIIFFDLLFLFREFFCSLSSFLFFVLIFFTGNNWASSSIAIRNNIINEQPCHTTSWSPLKWRPPPIALKLWTCVATYLATPLRDPRWNGANRQLHWNYEHVHVWQRTLQQTKWWRRQCCLSVTTDF